MIQGWIKLHRQIWENEYYFADRFTRASAWIDLILLANHKPQTLFIRGVEIHLEKGQLCYSQVSLAKRWQWNVRTVSEYLSALSRRKMIHTKINNVSTVITICKYERYQQDAEQSAEQSNTRIHSRVQTNNNDKNEKNEKNKILLLPDAKAPPPEIKKYQRLPLEKQTVYYRICYFYEDTMKTNIVNFPKQFKAIKLMLQAGYTEEQICRTVTFMATKDEFFHDKGFDLVNVAGMISRYKAESGKVVRSSGI